MNVSIRPLGAMVGLAALAFAGGAIAKEKAKKQIVHWTVADLQWKEVPKMPIMQAEAWHHGPTHCQFNKFPKGFSVPLHTHTADFGSVVLLGNFGSSAEGEPERLQGPGGYQFIPGGLKHTTKCGADSECVVYTCMSGPFDLKPVGEAKAKK